MNKLFVGAIAAGLLSSATVFGEGVACADTMLIVPGTAPSPYKPLRSLYHFNPATQPEIGQKYYNPAATKQVIPYPGSFWPVTGTNSPTVGKSVATGTNNLDAAIHRTEGPMAAAGLSQGTLALDREQERLAHDPTAPPRGDLKFIKAGDPNNLLTKLFRPGTHVPVIDYTVPGAVQSQYDTVNVVGQYDIFSDPPDHMGNLLADVNAITAGGYYGHSATAFSDPATVAPWDIHTTTNSLGATSTTYFIRSGQLPMVRALVDMAHLDPQAASRLDTTLRPMVDRAYTRNGPSPASGVNPLRALTNGGPNPGAIAPSISIPIESTTGGISAASSAVNVATLAARAGTAAANAAKPAAAKPGKGLLPKVGRLLLKQALKH